VARSTWALPGGKAIEVGSREIGLGDARFLPQAATMSLFLGVLERHFLGRTT